jgi:hypothetical protein
VVDTGARSAGEAVGDRRRQRRMTQLEMHAAGVKFVTWRRMRRRSLYGCRYNNTGRNSRYGRAGRRCRGELARPDVDAAPARDMMIGAPMT